MIHSSCHRLAAVLMLLVFAGDPAWAQRRLASSSRFLLGTESRLSASVRAGDLDGDGDSDLVVANGRHWPQQNMLLFNHGGRMTVARPLGVDLCTSYACELADLDGDGDLDIAVGNDTAPCLVFKNDGRGHFERFGQVGQPSSVRSITTADVDSDGHVDLLLTCRGRVNQIFFNEGDGRFGASVMFGTPDDSTIDVAVADLNGDGHQDLILANRDAQPNTIMLGRGERQFHTAVPFGGVLSSRAVAVADFDGDGQMDWVVGNIAAANVICFGDGAGGVREEKRLANPQGRTYCLAVADLNQDGRPDIVCGNAGQPNIAHLSTGGGYRQVEFGDPQSMTYGLCLTDLNGDGYVDAAVANSDQPNRFFLNLPAEKGRP
ncbi:MAG: VCBS repeat-containing protein [Planctomycetaceae bacterium]|nr:VCBS repeat-containing protein [Planctomycetaceae bacterium]